MRLVYVMYIKTSSSTSYKRCTSINTLQPYKTTKIHSILTYNYIFTLLNTITIICYFNIPPVGICCISVKHTVLMSKNKDWVARNQNNVS